MKDGWKTLNHKQKTTGFEKQLA